MASKVKCEKCGNEFLIINKEIEFYKEKDFPLPKKCPTCRLERRMALRNKKELYGYNCDNCKKDIVVAFEPTDEQKVYCKECYQKYMQENDNILGYSEGAKAQAGKQTEAAPNDETKSSTPPPTQNNTTNDPFSF